MRVQYLLVVAAVASAPVLLSAQHGDLTHGEPAVSDAAVDFGVLPFPATTPLRPPPCATGLDPAVTIGGPFDPCSYKLHHLTPEEATIEKGFLKTGRYLVCMNGV